MTSEVINRGLPFGEAIDFLQKKHKVPTERWNDIWQGAHSRAFMVAGLRNEQCLADIHTSLLRAMEEGKDLKWFRKNLNEIAGRHGWKKYQKGGRKYKAWRSRIIYQTNIRSAYAAGRWEQIQSTKETRPYLRYTALMDGRERPEHGSWHNTILPVDDGWWSTHTPPNGWGCRCSVQSLNDRDLGRRGLKVAKKAPRVRKEIRPMTTSAGRVMVSVPQGISPGFAYNAGTGNYADFLGFATLRAWGMNKKKWMITNKNLKNWKDHGLEEKLPVLKKMKPSPSPSSGKELEESIAKVMGGGNVIMKDVMGGAVRVNAKSLALHLYQSKGLKRGKYISGLLEAIKNPQEIWRTIERRVYKGRSMPVIRKRYICNLDFGEQSNVIFVIQGAAGMLEDLTFLNRSQKNTLNNVREGFLLYKKGGTRK